ncbi:MAG: hypothetical protein D8M58_14665 [Calditrichaeota bacterium]|nr:MAG: hypothetical protein DWQ03_15905 [Calditrichota bacterium]MBL1206645.1 hypothetical protein [Calditrichota bacterium]NOG46472.1 hypothetical protein [Calditrichota bacterium]
MGRFLTGLPMDYNNKENTFAQKLDVPFNELEIKTNAVLSAMGYNPANMQNVPTILIEEINTLFKTLEEHLKIKAGYKLFSASEVEIGKTEIHIKKSIFKSGKIINGQIKHAESLLLFVCTLGKEYDACIEKIKSENDMFTVYVADTIGSELVELAIDWMEQNICGMLEGLNYKHSNRFSPGYCGWPLKDQHTLFSFLPQNFCGINLHESALMSPIKSVSGIYGLGKSIKKKAYQCSICDKTDCYKRNHQGV